MTIFNELNERNLIFQSTGEEELQKLLETQQTIYCGFDPTGESLHVGHLFPMKTLMRFAKSGHNIICVVGGATGMIGDPSGKNSERQLLDESTIQENVTKISNQLEKIATNAGVYNNARFVNNYEWTSTLNLIDFFRSVGKHFPLTQMLAKESVKNRIEAGISYTEFSYQVLQSLDFEHLYRTYNCTIQIGGSDQWGNMTAGMEYIRRKNSELGTVDNEKAHVITFPLLTKSDGTKFGKSEGGAVWLDANKTSPFQYYQFWFNVSDADVVKYLKYFSDLNSDELKDLSRLHEEAPHLRIAQKQLAKEMTILVHGENTYAKVIEMSAVLFSNEFSKLSAPEILEILEGVKTIYVDESITIIDALVQNDLAKSNREARTFVGGGAVAINGVKCLEECLVEKSMAIDEKVVVLKRGKKNYGIIIFK